MKEITKKVCVCVFLFHLYITDKRDQWPGGGTVLTKSLWVCVNSSPLWIRLFFCRYLLIFGLENWNYKWWRLCKYVTLSLMSLLIKLFWGIFFVLAYRSRTRWNKNVSERASRRLVTKSAADFYANLTTFQMCVSSLMELWHRFPASVILMKWDNCFPLASPDELGGCCCCCCYWAGFDYNCKLF